MKKLPKPGDVVLTRNGITTLIYKNDVPGEYPIHGWMEYDDQPACWTEDGLYIDSYESSSRDLMLEDVPDPKKMKVWLHIYTLNSKNNFYLGRVYSKNPAEMFDEDCGGRFIAIGPIEIAVPND